MIDEPEVAAPAMVAAPKEPLHATPEAAAEAPTFDAPDVPISPSEAPPIDAKLPTKRATRTDRGAPSDEAVAGPAQHIRARSAAGADGNERSREPTPASDDEDLEVPSFLRQRGRSAGRS